MQHTAGRAAAAFLFVSTLVSTLLLAACGGGPTTASPPRGSSPSAPSTPSNPSNPAGPPSVSACGVLAGGQSQLAIVNGTACSASNSSVVFLNRRDRNNQPITTGCSGTVISSRAVLTAAHCLSGVSSATISVGGGATIAAVSLTASPNSQDVGVILTGQDIPLRAFALLSSRDARVGEQAVVAGWGLDENNSAGTLRAGTMTIAGVTGDYLQTQYTAGGSSSGLCSGDSGGALLVFQGGAWVLAGIPVSISAGCTETGIDSFVNVRNPGVASFIAGLVPGVSFR